MFLHSHWCLEASFGWWVFVSSTFKSWSLISYQLCKSPIGLGQGIQPPARRGASWSHWLDSAWHSFWAQKQWMLIDSDNLIDVFNSILQLKVIEHKVWYFSCSKLHLVNSNRCRRVHQGYLCTLMLRLHGFNSGIVNLYDSSSVPSCFAYTICWASSVQQVHPQSNKCLDVFIVMRTMLIAS